MKTYPSIDEKTGSVFAFEIEHVYLSNAAVARILSKISDVSDVRVRTLFSKWQGIHIWFNHQGSDFVVFEPYGDSSRYWIGPKDSIDVSVDLGRVMAAFENYHPPLLVEVIGDVLSLKIPSPIRCALKKVRRKQSG
ncbi:MAG: hypothetical protein Q8L45_02745 [Xanthomonadaceae bacterium]|nr:hypothetical protein [Xanthomonadaceae bacterium]MDZ4114880.1 hypothetical protein [Xanthomonadaceae bacterium]MDZ4376986.1 hypothetical protein [Xanthomonadaceae bacterium]